MQLDVADSTCSIFNNEMIYVKSSCTSEQDLDPDPELERWEEKLPTLTLLTSNSKSEREH